MSEKIVIGVDIGGTTIKVGICSLEGELLHTFEGPTGVENGSDAVCQNIADYAKLIVEQSPFNWDQVEGVGIGIAGFLGHCSRHRSYFRLICISVIFL